MEPNKTEIDRLSQDLGVNLSNALTDWFRGGGEQSFGSWHKVMRRELEASLVEYLVGPYSNSLRRRGFRPISALQAQMIVARTVFDTRDLYARLVNAPERTVTAGFFVDTLLRKVHQGKIVQSILHRIRDVFGRRSVQQTSGFTGRCMWLTNVPASVSRHGHLNGVIIDVSAGERFQVRPGVFWIGPREDMLDAEESSGCRCELLWEKESTADGGDTIWT